MFYFILFLKRKTRTIRNYSYFTKRTKNDGEFSVRKSSEFLNLNFFSWCELFEADILEKKEREISRNAFPQVVMVTLGGTATVGVSRTRGR